MNGPSAPLKLPSCPSGQGGRQPRRQAQPAATAAAATEDVSGSEDKAGNDRSDEDKSCSAEEDNKGAKRNRAHQKDYTQRKRVRACEFPAATCSTWCAQSYHVLTVTQSPKGQ